MLGISWQNVMYTCQPGTRPPHTFPEAGALPVDVRELLERDLVLPWDVSQHLGVPEEMERLHGLSLGRCKALQPHQTP